MPSGGLLRDPGRMFHDASFQRSVMIQAAILATVLILSAFYHFVVRRPRSSYLRSVDGVKDEDLAEVDALIVYPLKSGRGIELRNAEVSRKGFKYDRRWAIVRKEGLKRLNLKDEPRLTHIIPSFDGETLALHIGEDSPVQLPNIAIPLDASETTLRSWPLVEDIAFYGDTASGREVQLAQGAWDWKKTPSEWVSQLLGYPVHFLQFDVQSSKRDAFPLFRPPHDLHSWDAKRQAELKGPTQIEFQDIYPFLVATRESLAVVNEHVRTTIEGGSMKVDRSFWSKQDEIALPIQRFRPNIVLRSRGNHDGSPSSAPRYPGFSEDSWETIWIESKSGSTLPVHLVARCERCLLTTVDPQTAHRDANVPLAMLRKHRTRDAQPGIKPRGGPCFGMYSIPEQIDGQRYTTISVGDPVRVRWRPYELDDEVKLGSRSRRG